MRTDKTEERGGLPVLRSRFNRRRFLAGSGVLAIAFASEVVGVGCGNEDDVVSPKPGERAFIPDQHWMYGANVPEAPYVGEPVPEEPQFFTDEEFATVEAAMARILPGSEAEPGAREMGTAQYLDVKLATVEGFWAPTYFEPPYMKTYSGSRPPVEVDENGFDGESVWIPESEKDRYGFQSSQTPREAYRSGLEQLNGLARERFGAPFAELSEGEQDSLLSDLEGGNVSGFEQPSGKAFFEMLREDTIDGAFSDPGYGGNREFAGWLFLDYPGAQRGYTPLEMHTERNNRLPQGLAELHGFRTGGGQGPNEVIPLQHSGLAELPYRCAVTPETEAANADR